MYAAKFTANNPSPILPSRPIFAPTEFRISLATPLESALARNAIHHFVTPIKSIPFFRISPLRAKFASVTPVSTTLTEHAPYNPIRMNTSGNRQVAIPLPPNATNSYKTTYPKPSLESVNHYTHHPPPQFAPSFFRSPNIATGPPDLPRCFQRGKPNHSRNHGSGHGSGQSPRRRANRTLPAKLRPHTTSFTTNTPWRESPPTFRGIAPQ
jgi:hypothetical protein